jgi:hypothetical protein
LGIFWGGFNEDIQVKGCSGNTIEDNSYAADYNVSKISGHQQRMPGPLPGAILIPPALLVVADFMLLK